MERYARFWSAVVIAAMMMGCASSPVERQEATQTSLADLQNATEATRDQIEQALASLIRLMNAPPEQLRSAYQEYVSNVETLARQEARIEAEARQVQERSDAWLAAWQRSYGEIDNVKLRDVTERRRQHVLERFEKIEGSLRAAEQALNPFVQNLQDIRNVVSNDLTPNGVTMVSGTEIVGNAVENGADASRALRVTMADLQSLIVALGSATAA